MRMYAPEVGGDVILACFDQGHRIALIRPEPPAAGHPLRLPTVQRRGAESYGRAARRLARELAPTGAVRMGKVTGLIRAAGPGCASRRPVERRLFTAHATFAGGVCAAGELLAWVPYAQVVGRTAGMAIAELGLFLEGYVGGWIPDGWISLE
ncbi:hypothetical protein OG887_17085 [Streptomyces sp. NBC_00053]|uniref:hypothetical protein n=1 Tax=unclassified Streptomyces TaxID=2593676 RepID=UPI00224DB3C0|nr:MULTISPECIES: hypothetical protein [unclassified Streptomyces]WSG51394.1 hypothetical protein OHA38_17220 [Streptomyces sp. NBC_01732]WSX02051.1 hypothetical protein OG355_17345 [Streptomyces sp. NBC_00987]MCX5101318.1 hypothetical protein [Streptomyces sp. NBC_00439]MCX5160839.1 hypothetical protein [Streptomyces sp. NBC_00305]MCX5219362.1 hypothetical protein [Streptomyces sp. NBC_00264]